MISNEFVKKCAGKKVHVDFLDFKTGNKIWVDGNLVRVDSVKDKNYIEIENDTDFNRIPIKDVRKIYLK